MDAISALILSSRFCIPKKSGPVSRQVRTVRWRLTRRTRKYMFEVFPIANSWSHPKISPYESLAFITGLIKRWGTLNQVKLGKRIYPLGLLVRYLHAFCSDCKTRKHLCDEYSDNLPVQPLSMSLSLFEQSFDM